MSDTFAAGTQHTLKMFYLERGNTANMSMSFNMQTPQFQQVAKVDDNGNAMEGVQFDLYPLTLKNGHSIKGFSASIDDFDAVDTSTSDGRVATTVTGADGMGNIHDPGNANKPYDFDSQAEAGQLYYMLVERTPDGYMSAKNPTLLVYDAYNAATNPGGTNMLLVMSRFNAGTYSSFTAFANVKNDASYVTASSAGTLNESKGDKIPSGTSWWDNVNDKRDGLAIAVPSTVADDGTWLPLYGTNVMGWDSVKVSQQCSSFHDRALAAVLYQASAYPRQGWVLGYNSANQKISGELSGFPDRARSYLSQSDDGFLRLDYLIFDGDALKSLGVTGSTPQSRYDNLVNAVNKRITDNNGNVDDAVMSMVKNASSNSNLIYREDVTQTFKSMIYVGNAQNRLYLQKTDAQYTPLKESAEFTIYSDASCTEASKLGSISTNQNNDSLIEFIFDLPEGQSGRADGSTLHLPVTHGTYYLKETKAPDGFELNENVIELQNTPTGAHVSAGNDHDDIDVGITQLRLTSPMVQFAYDDGYYSTLTGVTATLGSSAKDNDDVTRDLVLDKATRRYVVAAENGNEEVSIANPLFRTDEGTVDLSFKQGKSIHENSANSNHTDTRWEDLNGDDITDLFYPVRTVYVQDTYGFGDLLIDNTITNAPDRDKNRVFNYELHMKDKNDVPLSGTYVGYVMTKANADAISSSSKTPTDAELAVRGIKISVTFVNGVADVPLAGEQALYIRNLPRNACLDTSVTDADFTGEKAVTRENAPGYDYSVTGADGTPITVERIKSSVLPDSLTKVHLNNEYHCAYFQVEKFVRGKGANPIYPFIFELHFYTAESMSDDSEITPERNPEFFPYAMGGDQTGYKDSYNNEKVVPNDQGRYAVKTVAGRQADDPENPNIIEHDDAILNIEVPTSGRDIWVKVMEGVDTNYFALPEDYEQFLKDNNIAADTDVPEEGEIAENVEKGIWRTRSFKLSEYNPGDDAATTPKATYCNQVRRGTLTIKKTVVDKNGNAAPGMLEDKFFDFAISLYLDPEMSIPMTNADKFKDGYQYKILKDGVEQRPDEEHVFTNGDIVKIKKDEQISIIGLPAGSFYISNETKTPGFMPNVEDGKASGTIDPDKEEPNPNAHVSIPFENIYSPRSITISKKLVDKATGKELTKNDNDTEFTFLLTLFTDEAGTQVYSGDPVRYYTKTGGDENQVLSGKGDDSSSFKLKATDYIVFDTPDDVKTWKVEELPHVWCSESTAEYFDQYNDAENKYDNLSDATDVKGNCDILGNRNNDISFASKVVVAPNDTPCEMVVTNVHDPIQVEVPFTGMTGIILFAVAGIALVVASCASLLWRGRKSSKRCSDESESGSVDASEDVSSAAGDEEASEDAERTNNSS